MTTTMYLCGPVEWAKSAGDWRQMYEDRLASKNIVILNPLKKPEDAIPEAKMPQKAYWDAYFDALKKGVVTDDLRSAFRGMKAVIDICLDMVRRSDIVVCRLTPTFTVGTIEELVLAKQMATFADWKRVFFVCPEGIPSFWLLVEFAPEPERIKEVFFDTDEDFLSFLEKELEKS
ncbi:MAG: hypothetical protein Q8K86_07245 [Candidatus Nanopelagicaceae bacterium]|nr:hypothetical protein [Candidatus Nanopelagicaceae bacterium]